LNNKKIFLYFLYSIIIAGAYYGSSLIVKPIILPPSFAAPIWPAAGIGVAVLILWGYRFIPAILLGDILIYIDFYIAHDSASNFSSFITLTVMMVATLMRSVIGAYLVNNYLGQSNSYLTFHSTSRLLVFAGLVPTFISSFLSIIALSYSGFIENDSQLINFIMWWFGDSIGIFIVLPFMLLLFKKPRKIWYPRLLKTAIPVVITLSLLMFVANYLKNLEQERLMTVLDSKIELLKKEILAIYAERELDSEWMSKEQAVEGMSHIFKTNTHDINLIKKIDDVHYLIYSMGKKQKVLLFESNNKLPTTAKMNSTKSLEFLNHNWVIEAYATSRFYYNNASWMVWWFLSIGFLFISLMGAGLLVITGNNIIVNEKVTKRTKEINTLNNILKASEARYKQLVEIQPVIFWKHIAGDKTLEFLSKDAVEVFGYPMQTLLNFDTILNKLVHPEDRKRVIKEYKVGLKSNKRFEIKYRGITKAGKHMWFKDYVSSNNVNGKLEVLGLKVDITKDQEKELKISQLAFYDNLTKLPNRIKFMNFLHIAINNSLDNNTIGSILYLDLDRFKVLNDSLGYDFGNKLLIQIAERIKSILSPQDVIARIGGDEFIVLLDNQYESLENIQSDSLEVSQNIQKVMNRPFRISGTSYHATFSIGVSLFPYDSPSTEEVIQQAEIAMYFSKHEVKNTVSFFKKNMQEEANKRLVIEKSLTIALIRHEFEMFYQPIFDENKNVIKLESLIRWNHPTEGLLMPNEFIHIAEETGFIMELSEWVIDNVFERISRWRKEHNQTIHVSINISLYQFKNAAIFEILDTIANQYQIDTSTITLELTETIGIEDFDDTLSKLIKLKNLGFKLAIDDFGTGYSSLHYLAQMPIDILKIDKIFVAKIGMGKSSDALIGAILLMAKQLDLDVIVEGVETKLQFEFLKDLGCNKFQGYLVSEALQAFKVIELINSPSKT
jgi:diguanylate cyclase (GGDEF)-like protein/PAS domain S-box-containing protein